MLIHTLFAGTRAPKNKARWAQPPSYRSLRHFERLESRNMLAVTFGLGEAQALLGGTNINASDNALRDQAEMSIAVNPTNPLNIAGFTHSFVPEANGLPSDRTQIDLMYSFDGGLTWDTITIDDGTHGIDDSFGYAETRFDPTIQFDALGHLFIGYGHYDGAETTHLIVARSNDGGRTISGFTAVDSISGPGGSFLDKWHLATGFDPSTENQAVYIAYTRTESNFERAVLVAGSNDGGQSFLISDPLNDPLTSSLYFTQFPHPSVGPNGELYVSWDDVEFSKISVDVDIDGLFGTTHNFGTDTLVTNLTTSFFKAPIPAQPNRGVSNAPVIDVDRSGGEHRGRVYLVWADAVTLPNTNIYLSYSDDSGSSGSWSPPIAVVSSAASEFLPWLDIDQTTGSVNVVYYESAELAGGTDEEVNVVLRSSLDGGATFASPVTLSTARSSAPLRDIDADFLEYIGLAAHDGTVHVIWADNRNNPTSDFEAYTASASFLSVSGDNVLTITGDDGDIVTNDTIELARSTLNSDYLEVKVNGILQFAGLVASVNIIEIESRAGNDSITIDADIDADIVIRGGLGADAVTLRGKGDSALGNFEFLGEAGNDTFTIDFRTGDPLPRPGFNFNFIGGDGIDNAIVIEDGGAQRTGWFVDTFTDAVDLSSLDPRPDSHADPDDQITLRAAIQEANRASTETYIFLPTGTYALSITGTGGDTEGDLEITANVAIIGTGAGQSVIDADAISDRVFDVAAGGVLELSGLTLL